MPHLRLDEKLLAGFRAGRRESLDIVYRMYAPSVRECVRVLVRGTRCASLYVPIVQEDIVQDVFTQAFSERARLMYDATRDYGPYLKAVARNLVLDMIRRGSRERVVSDDQLEKIDATEDRVAYETEVLTATRTYLNELPDPVRGVYVQRFVLGHSQRHACTVLGISRRCLRTREAHLVRGLRQQLRSGGLLEVTGGYNSSLKKSQIAGAAKSSWRL